jgi:hypothetical protein
MAKIKITESQLERLVKENARVNSETKKQTVVTESTNVKNNINEATKKIMADFKRFK